MHGTEVTTVLDFRGLRRTRLWVVDVGPLCHRPPRNFTLRLKFLDLDKLFTAHPSLESHRELVPATIDGLCECV